MKNVISFGLVYIIVCVVCFTSHAIVEHHYYQECRRNLWVVFGSMVSPYCAFVRRTLRILEALPVNVLQRGLQTVLAPLVHIVGRMD
jgi:hypothetical protein